MASRRYRLSAGVIVESIGDGWAAFSRRTGRTMILNDEAAAILEVLADGPADSAMVCRRLAHDAADGMADVPGEPAEMIGLVDAAWPTLERAGLVEPLAER